MLGGALCVVDGHDLPVCAHVPYRPRPTGRGATVVVGVGKRSKERGGEVDFGSRRLTLKDNFGVCLVWITELMEILMQMKLNFSVMKILSLPKKTYLLGQEPRTPLC